MSQVVFHLEHAGAFLFHCGAEVALGLVALGAHAGPEVRRGQAAGLERGAVEALPDELRFVDLADEESRHRPGPAARELRLPQLAEKPLAAEYEALVAQSQAGVEHERG